MGDVLNDGYTIVPGPFGAGQLHDALAACDLAMEQADPDEIKIGSNCIRVTGILNRAPILVSLLLHKPLLEVADEIIGGPFKLSAFNARKVRPGAAAQLLHQDVTPGSDGWPLVGFILMVDTFRPENGATRFVPRSQHLAAIPAEQLRKHPDEQHACGPAGSMIIFHGSAWHGYGANLTRDWRRSVYGSLIPQSARAAMDHRESLPPKLWRGLPTRAQELLQS
jgi:ectoine hydroxylase-related dioxygenase (phytanoyl-CoA dioxygenase family)